MEYAFSKEGQGIVADTESPCWADVVEADGLVPSQNIGCTEHGF